MGKNLNFEEELDSLDAIKTLYFKCNKDTSTHLRNVEVIDKQSNNIIFIGQVPISIAPETNTYKIYILWEQAGISNFNSLQLFGVYWSSYNKMSYDEISECLVINSSNSDKLVKVYY